MAISAEQVAVVERKHPNLWSRSSWILSHTAAFFPSVEALFALHVIPPVDRVEGIRAGRVRVVCVNVQNSQKRVGR